ncbi:hypothetical protein AB7092_13400 [Providencia rettgeri]|uniref:LpxL/LpxP family acyltransferase n=1 Tax=Providencia TaxID=586 RepID=UPI00234BBF5F|nr:MULTISPECIES: hypothetical protein [unclassified Providencia]
MKGGKAIWFAPDQDFGRKGTVFVPFFSVKHTSTSKGISMHVQLSFSPILIVILLRNHNDVNYNSVLGKEIVDYSCNDVLLEATIINSILDKQIMKSYDLIKSRCS